MGAYILCEYRRHSMGMISAKLRRISSWKLFATFDECAARMG